MRLKSLIFACIVLFFATLTYPQFELKEMIKGIPITSVCSDGTDLWFSTNGKGIFQFNYKSNKIVPYQNENTKSGNDLFDCVAASPNFIWAGASDGLYIFDRKKEKWSKKTFATGGQYGNWVRTLAFDSLSNVLWIGRFINLSSLDVKSQKITDYDLTQKKDPKTNRFTAIGLDPEGFVWFGTEAGVFKYDKNKDLKEKSSYDFVTSKGKSFVTEGKYVSLSGFLFDRGNVWFATDEFISEDSPKFNTGGLYKHNKKAQWEIFNRSNGLPGNGISALVRVGNSILVASYEYAQKTRTKIGHGLSMFDRISGKLQKINFDSFNLKTSMITSLYFDGSLLWIGTDIGLYTFKISNSMAEWALAKKPIKIKTKN